LDDFARRSFSTDTGVSAKDRPLLLGVKIPTLRKPPFDFAQGRLLVGHPAFPVGVTDHRITHLVEVAKKISQDMRQFD